MFPISVLYNEIMENLNYNPECWKKEPCPKMDCHKKTCCCGLKFVLVPSALTETMPPEKGQYNNAIVEYEATGEIYIYSAEGIPVKIKEADAS